MQSNPEAAKEPVARALHSRASPSLTAFYILREQ